MALLEPRNLRRKAPQAALASLSELELEQVLTGNPICGDEISVYLKAEDEAFSALTFSGQGCAISKASASLMTEALSSLPLEEAKARVHEIVELLGKDFEGDPFERHGQLGALTAVRRYPARLKCATLAWHTFLAALAGETNASTE